MKRYALVLVTLGIALSLSACGGMRADTRKGKMEIPDQVKVFKGTPQRVGEQMAGFEKGKALAALYQQLVTENDPRKIKIIQRKIMLLEKPKKQTSSCRNHRYPNGNRFSY